MFAAKNICENQQKIYDNVIDVYNSIQKTFKILYDNQKFIDKRLNEIESLIKQIQDKKEVNND